MKDSTKNRVEGTLHEVKGKLTERAGQIANDPKLQADGQGEKVAGIIQKKVGRLEQLLGN